MNLLTPLRRPEYYYRPSQILRRLMLPFRKNRGIAKARLPWGHQIAFSSYDLWIGRSILSVGLDDLPLCETLWRILNPGDIAVDVGANIGMTASLMLTRAGPCGTVHAFEPHPKSFELLANNALLWGCGQTPPNLHLHACAVGAQKGLLALVEPDAWERHSGGVTVIPLSARAHEADLPVANVVTLDELFTSEIGVLKIDVEGHQDEVLNGASGLLSARKIRDVVFEITRDTPLPYKMTAWLESNGYQCFGIDREFKGPLIRRVGPGSHHAIGHATNLIATIDATRARHLLDPRGWECLRSPNSRMQLSKQK